MSEREWWVDTRRSFLQGGLLLGAAAGAPGCGLVRAALKPSLDPYGRSSVDRDDDPFERVPDGPAPRSFFGDDPQRSHSYLWDKKKAIADREGIPAVSERAKLVIIGGGLAGLSAAYHTIAHRPIILEGARRLGGNAKGQKWGDIAYSIGSAYMTKDDKTADHIRMLRDLGLHQLWREDDPRGDSMYLGGVVHPDFWFGGSDPSRKADFRAAWKYFEYVRRERFPDVPFDPNGNMDPDAFWALDHRSFEEEMVRALGERYHPHLADVVREYCWSSFGADSSEISAAAGLNFLASDLGGMYVLPGGNATIAQALVDRLRRELGEDHLRASAMVVDVARVDDGVRIVYADATDKLRAIVAEACIVASPKFIARKLIDTLPEKQLEAIGKLSYRAYLVTTALIDQPHDPSFHDLFCIAGKAPAEGDLKGEIQRRAFTDILLCTFARRGHPTRSVCNFYAGQAYEGSRAELFTPDAYDQARARVEEALPAVLKANGFDPAKVVDLRMTRWGHSLVFPRPGMISDGILEAASAPHAERIFFGQQDNWAMPSFETAYVGAMSAVEGARRVLGG